MSRHADALLAQALDADGVPPGRGTEAELGSCTAEGLGPLPGWMSRVLLPDAALRRVLVDRVTGLPLHLDDTVPPVLELDGVVHRRRPDDPPGPRPGRPQPPDTPSGTPDTPTPTLRRALADRRRLSAVLLGPALLAGPEPQYAPTARLRQLVQVRDQRCTGPGCPTEPSDGSPAGLVVRPTTPGLLTAHPCTNRQQPAPPYRPRPPEPQRLPGLRHAPRLAPSPQATSQGAHRCRVGADGAST